MRIVFYDSGFPSMGIQCIYATAKSLGHDVDVYYDPSLSRDHMAKNLPLAKTFSLSKETVVDDLIAMRPEVAAFSMHTLNFVGHAELLSCLKGRSPGVITVCGGIHPTLAPSAVLENEAVDFVVVGEGERSFPALLDALGRLTVDEVKALPPDALPGVWNRVSGGIVDRGASPPVIDLNQSPFPEKAVYCKANPALSAFYMAMGSRGCTYRCTFCNSPTLRRLHPECEVGFYRMRTVDSVMTELHEAVRRFHPRQIEFWDNIFGSDRKWLEEFTQRYRKEIGLPYAIQTSPLLHTEETLRLLAESGCVTMELGFQSANPDVRRNVLNRQETNERVKQVVITAERLGIGVELDFIVDLPGEVKAHVLEALDFVAETRPWKTYMFFLQYFPGTAITDKALDAGILKPEDVTLLEHGLAVSSLRFSARSGLDSHYRLIPLQLFLARHLPKSIAPRAVRWVDRPVLGEMCSWLALPMMYATHLFSGLFSRRDTYTRYNMLRMVYSIKRVVLRKFLGRPL